MRIKQISVSGLFGIFDHVIPLNMDERITIIHGPNGFGKTVMLKMLDGFVNSRYSGFQSIPFSKFQVKFDDCNSVEIVNNLNDPENNNSISNLEKIDLDIISFTSKDKSISANINFSIKSLDNLIPEINRIDPKYWHNFTTGEILSLDDVLERFDHFVPPEIANFSRDEPKWLKEFKSRIYVRLIESERLLNLFFSPSYRFDKETASKLSTVSAYSNELAELMQKKFTEYGKLSQSLDRTFPGRVVNQKSSTEITEEKLLSQLNELEKTRSRLIEVGLLDKDDNTDFKIQPKSIDESTKNILSVYIEDVATKLDVFSEIANKIELLRKIINRKFIYSYKKINFSKEKGFVFTTCYDPSSASEQKTLAPTDLSSGEQHELIMLYELLFKVEPKTLVLIDEPELSLHVGWQVEFIKDLQEITELADLDILMATHSPDIIQNRWDLTVELKGLEN
ncbi:MAG: AAA family ATPase [Symploca sp. SIO1C2]|nr:AAA family ATPase [Symploca sp. SIO1C2]